MRIYSYILCGCYFWVLSTMSLEARPLTVVSLDMCADQYALNLLPKSKILGLSQNARHTDSYYRQKALGIKFARVSFERLLVDRPDAVIRTWGGEARLIASLKKNGIKVININDVKTFPEAFSELERVGEALGVSEVAKAEATRARLALTGLPKPSKPLKVLYYTPSGYSAGEGTWVSEIFNTLGHTLISRQDGYYYLSPEVFLSEGVDIYALGFYDNVYAMRRVPGRHPLVRSKIAKAKHIALPSPVLACNAWYGAYALSAIAQEMR
jgi:iron complex transport system substrate-binding protein